MEFCGAGSVSDLMKIRNKTVSGECCVDVHVCNPKPVCYGISLPCTIIRYIGSFASILFIIHSNNSSPFLIA